MESEIVKTKQLRKDIDEILQRTKDLSSTRERSFAVMKLKEVIIWLGMHLETLNNSDSYSENKDPKSKNYVAPTADNLKM